MSLVNWEIIEEKSTNLVDLSEEEAHWLLERQSDMDLAKLYAFANYVNEKLNGPNVSFIHNMNINYTNFCDHHCTFCAYKKPLNSEEAYILGFDEIARRIESAAGPLSEITFQGGLSSLVKFDEVIGLLSLIHQAYPNIHIHAFSPEEIYYYANQTSQSVAEVIDQCRQVGMGSLCGTAAEILDDEIRRKICPEKVSSDRWCEIVKTAHRMGLHSTSTILFGHVEGPQHVVNHLKKIRDIQRETGMITEFIPLLFAPDNTKLKQKVNACLDRAALGFRMIAVARLYFMNDIRNIQTSWVKLGWENALRSLSVGANDMSGTLYQENITREAGGLNGEYVPLEKFVSDITRAGKIPVERDTLYSYQNGRVPDAV